MVISVTASSSEHGLRSKYGQPEINAAQRATTLTRRSPSAEANACPEGARSQCHRYENIKMLTRVIAKTELIMVPEEDIGAVKADPGRSNR
jgi:hypothetical protein